MRFLIVPVFDEWSNPENPINLENLGSDKSL